MQVGGWYQEVGGLWLVAAGWCFVVGDCRLVTGGWCMVGHLVPLAVDWCLVADGSHLMVDG